MATEVIEKAKKIKKRRTAYFNTKIIILVLFLLFLLVFIILNFLFNVNKFSVSITDTLEKEYGIIIYDNEVEMSHQRKLFADGMDNMGDMSIKWLPEDIHSASNGGSNNGDNYIAYTFFIENAGRDTINYFYEIIVDDVIKEVDEAVRIVVYRNDEERTVWAKLNKETGLPEKDTTPFYDYEKTVAAFGSRYDFKVEDIDKYTIVIFLEGDDPECLNNLIGGEIKMHMEIREEYIDPIELKRQQDEERKKNIEKYSNNSENDNLVNEG